MSDLSRWHRKFLWLGRVNGKWVFWEWIEVRVSPMDPFEEQRRILCHPQLLR